MTHSRHEQLDLNPVQASLFMGFLILLVAIVLAASLGVFHLFATTPRSTSASGLDGLIQTFPEPRLQIEPQQDLIRLQEKNRNILRTYAWVDREHRVVRIPIERAIDTVLQQGLPEFPEGESK